MCFMLGKQNLFEVLIGHGAKMLPSRVLISIGKHLSILDRSFFLYIIGLTEGNLPLCPIILTVS